MDIFQALILGVVEGIAEFLPISSTGHLILTSYALNLPDTNFVKSFEIVIQLGAILAIVVLYWRTLLLKRSYWPKLFIAFVPTALVGFTLYPVIKNILLSSPLITVLSLLIGGILLIIIEKIHTEKEHHVTDLSHLTLQQAAIIGVFQSLAVIPGVSRSASTIIGGMLTGAKRTAAVEFSFLLAVPTMLAASGYDLLKSYKYFSSGDAGVLLVGFVAAFIVALLAVKYFLKYVQHHTFIPFGIYRIVLAIVYAFIFLR